MCAHVAHPLLTGAGSILSPNGIASLKSTIRWRYSRRNNPCAAMYAAKA